jgi:hypothetical protein
MTLENVHKEKGQMSVQAAAAAAAATTFIAPGGQPMIPSPHIGGGNDSTAWT